jgi:diguanylate cyclase (GGDEF)-like protein
MKSKDRRLTLAYLSNQIQNEYHSDLWQGIKAQAKIRDVNILVFVGNNFNCDDGFIRQENVSYNILDEELIDGFILSSSSLSGYIRFEDYEVFLKRFAAKPTVSIGRKIDRGSSIMPDNKNGMKAVIDHLIEKHRFTRLAFMTGPETNKEAQIRLEAYKESLEDHGIPFDPELIVPGNFTSELVEKSTQLLFDDRKKTCEAIICANDSMASTLYRVLALRGIRIPDDIAITGFDGIYETGFFSPPLTTVYQPIRDMAAASVDLVISMIENGKEGKEIVFPALPLIRQSCGCLPLPDYEMYSGTKLRDNECAAALFSVQKSCKKETIDAILEYIDVEEKDRAIISASLGELYNAALNDISEKKVIGQFITLLNRLLTVSSVETDALHFDWSHALYVLRKHIVSGLADYEQKVFAEDMFQRAQILNADIDFRSEGARQYSLIRNEEEIRGLWVITNNFGSGEDVFSVFSRTIPRLGIKRCFIAFFEDGIPKQTGTTTWEFPERSRLKMSIDDNGAIAYGDTGPVFRTTRLVPEVFLPRDENFIWMIRILYARDRCYGYMINELNRNEEYVYLSLHDIVSMALQSTDLWRRRVEAEESLLLRTKELEELNKKLSKLDDLKNDFIANITHDFRSPLMIMLNTVDLGLKYDNTENQDVKKRYTVIYNAAFRLKNEIDRLLDLQKMDAYGLKLRVRELNLKTFIESIADFYRSTVMSTNIKIVVNIPSGETDNIFTDAEKLEEIINNLLSNALKFVDPEKGEIGIEYIDMPDTARILIRDNGVGIPPSELVYIFDRFAQTEAGRQSRFKGTGIGLAFAKQLADSLMGKLWAESDGENKGALFIIELNKGKDHFAKGDFYVEGDGESDFRKSRDNMQQLISIQLGEKENRNGITVRFRILNNDDEYDVRKAIILIVEDNEYILNIEHEYLVQAGYVNFVFARDGKDGVEAAFTYRPDIIVCDYNMPKMKGDAFHDELINNPDFASIPFIFLTAITNKEVLIRRKKKGAVAVLPKPIDENDFLLTIELNLKRYMEYRKTLRQAVVDELTGLNNKRNILKIFRERIALRSFRPVSLIFFDIDHFKLINDTYGHPAGDEILAEVGKATQETIRNYDVAGRYGGEEFLVMLPETNKKEAMVVAEKLMNRFNSMAVKYNELRMHITVSFGISSLIENEKELSDSIDIESLKEIYEVADGKTADWARIDAKKREIADTLIVLADKALYRAKSSICTSCGFASIDETIFMSRVCPRCKGKEIHWGRNKIEVYNDPKK